MAEEAGLEKSQSGVSHLKWGLVLGSAILLVIALGIISSRALHGIMNKTGSSAASSQATSSQAGQ
jgi:hypothetical protein